MFQKVKETSLFYNLSNFSIYYIHDVYLVLVKAYNWRNTMFDICALYSTNLIICLLHWLKKNLWFYSLGRTAILRRHFCKTYVQLCLVNKLMNSTLPTLLPIFLVKDEGRLLRARVSREGVCDVNDRSVEPGQRIWQESKTLAVLLLDVQEVLFLLW